MKAIFIVIGIILFLVILGAVSNNKSSTTFSDALSPTPSSFPQASMPTDTPSPTPTPTTPDFPADITETKTYQYVAASNGTYTVTFTFNNPNERNVSIGISSTQFDDPGPIPDTSGDSWTFTNVPALSTQYVNMKAMVDGSWSDIDSWTLEIPSWTAPTTPIYYPYPVYYPQSTYTHCYSNYAGGMNRYSY